MAHIDYKSEQGGERSPEWYKVGAEIAELANKVSERSDLVGLAGPNAGGEAPACYKPAIAEVEVNTEIAFGFGVTPSMVGDINDRETQYEFPRATGAILHEAFHARFSGFDIAKLFDDLKEDEAKAFILLEETRIEKQGLDLDYKNRAFLRASAMDIVLGDVEVAKEATETSQLATLVGLVHGRLLAGVLEFDEVADVVTAVNTKLGADIVRQLSEILREFQAHTNHENAEPVYPLAIEWARIVRDRQEELGETAGDGAEGIAEIVEMLGEASERVSIKNYDSLLDQEIQEDWAEEAKDRAKGAKEQKKHKDEASQVFGKGTGPQPDSATRSTLIERRKPTSQERSASVIVARMLEKAKYRERDITEIASVLPPGRLRPKALVQGAALRERGVFTPVEAFRKTVRKHTDDPTLTVGVMVDISGSMSSAMNPMATTAWVMSEAVKRVQGKCSMVYFGNDVFPTLKAGQSLDEVVVYTAHDGTEKFDRAFQALDGSLDLLYGSGARLLVVVSDGCYTGSESRKAQEWVKRCEEAGVAILWLPFDSGSSAQYLLRNSRVRPLAGVLDPATAAKEIGNACAKALTAVGARH